MGYAYPSEMGEEDKIRYVRKTEEDAVLLNTTGTIAWEWMLSWKEALHSYFPLYSERNIMQGFFSLNVPYLFPILDLGHTKRIGNTTIIFNPIIAWYDIFAKNLTGQDVATKINKAKKGTVTYVYCAADSITIPRMLEVFQHLDAHVQVVDHQTLVKMAVASLPKKEENKRKQ